MEFVTIYRVENSFGEGPYFNKQRDKEGSSWVQTWAESPHNDSRHPEPFDDEVLKTKMDDNQFFMDEYICGFLNMEQVKSWFSEKELKNLAKIGYKLKAIEVFHEDVIVGKTQVLIKK